MARLIVIGLAIGAMALPAVMAPSEADAATCRSRKATGTVIGGLGGALIGNAVSKGGGGTRTTYYETAPRAAPAARPQAVRQVYYDHMGNPVASGEVRDGTFQQVSTAPGGVCRDATISYYDERGRLSQRAVQICPR